MSTFSLMPVLPPVPPEDENFFSQAALRLCDTLDVHKMLQNTVELFSNFLPCDAIGLSVYEMRIGAVRRFALCTPKGTVEEESLEIFPHVARLYSEKLLAEKTRIVLTNKVEENPIRLYLKNCGRSRYESALVLHMWSGNRHVGMLDIFSKKRAAFLQEHVDFLLQFEVPFTLFLDHFLQYRTLKNTVRQSVSAQERQGRAPQISVVGSSALMQEVLQKAEDVADTMTPVLLTGESGTGKDVLAEYIQQKSDRHNQAFIKVNCAAIPEGLMENEFFGHDANAYTGAQRQAQGRFERAHRGTLFLDEVGELSLGAQAKLLRVLENKEIERLGGSKSISIDVRMIAATNHCLLELVKKDLFRLDLYYRLNVFPIAMPPLRAHKEDIPELVASIVARKQKELNIVAALPLKPQLMEPLLAYHWPGNVRELINVVERALIYYKKRGALVFEIESSAAGRATPAPVPEGPAGRGAACEDRGGATDKADAAYLSLGEFEKNHIVQALMKSHGKIMGRNSAAQFLDINGYTLRKRMVKLGIDPKIYKKPC